MTPILDMLAVGLSIALVVVVLAIVVTKSDRRSRHHGSDALLLFGSRSGRWTSRGNLISVVAVFGLIGAALLLPPKSQFGLKGECIIKGNISFSGERIYHLPGDEYYEETIIDERYGERWFCSETDAVAAGWRHAKV